MVTTSYKYIQIGVMIFDLVWLEQAISIYNNTGQYSKLSNIDKNPKDFETQLIMMEYNRD